jgi:hypothetical protein
VKEASHLLHEQPRAHKRRSLVTLIVGVHCNLCARSHRSSAAGSTSTGPHDRRRSRNRAPRRGPSSGEGFSWVRCRLRGSTNGLPLRYFLTIVRGIIIKGIGIDYLWAQILLLLALGVAVFWGARPAISQANRLAHRGRRERAISRPFRRATMAPTGLSLGRHEPRSNRPDCTDKHDSKRYPEPGERGARRGPVPEYRPVSRHADDRIDEWHRRDTVKHG